MSATSRKKYKIRKAASIETAAPIIQESGTSTPSAAAATAPDSHLSGTTISAEDDTHLIDGNVNVAENDARNMMRAVVRSSIVGQKETEHIVVIADDHQPPTISASKRMIINFAQQFLAVTPTWHYDSGIEDEKLPDEIHTLKFGLPKRASTYNLILIPIILCLLSSLNIFAYAIMFGLCICTFSSVSPLKILSCTLLTDYAIMNYVPYGTTTVMTTGICLLLTSLKDGFVGIRPDISTYIAACIAFVNLNVSFLSFPPLILVLAGFCALSTIIGELEGARSIVFHHEISLHNESRSLHWFLVCLKLGVVGLLNEKEHTLRKYIDISHLNRNTLVKSIQLWLESEFPEVASELGSPTMEMIATYAMKHQRGWCLEPYSAARYGTIYRVVKSFYLYDRYLRPYFWRFCTMLYKGPTIQPNWRPTPAMVNSIDGSFWSLQECEKPQFVLPSYTPCSVSDMALGSSDQLTASIVSYGTLWWDITTGKNNFFQIAVAAVSAISSWTQILDCEMIIRFISECQFYIPWYATPQIFEAAFCSTGGLSKCPRLNACLHYGSEYLSVVTDEE